MADSDDEDLEALKLAALRTLRKRKQAPNREEPFHNVPSRSTSRGGEKIGRFSDQTSANAKPAESRSANTSRLNSRSNGDFDDLGDIDEYDVEIGLEPAGPDTSQHDQHAIELESAACDQLSENVEPTVEDDYEQIDDPKAIVEVDEEVELDYANGYAEHAHAVDDDEGEYTNEQDTQVEPSFGERDEDSGPVRSTVKIVASRDHSSSHSFASLRRDARNSKGLTHAARGSEDTHPDRRGRGPVRARLHGGSSLGSGSGSGSGSGAAPNANAEFDLRAKLGPSQRDRRADSRMVVGTRVTVGATPNNTTAPQQPQRGRNRNWRWTFS